MSVVTATATASRPNLRRLAWRHPEWWALAICAVAWAAMLRPHAHHMHVEGAQLIATRLASWMLMTLAMMLPLVVGPLRFAAERSLWRRRHRAIAGFLIGYLGCWLVAGIVVSFIEPGALVAAGAFAVAGAWQLTLRKRRALTACHRAMPLVPRGWRADRDCIVYGWRTGKSCTLSCWALMLACALSGHTLLATVFVTAIALIERYTSRVNQRMLSGALFGAAAITIAIAL